MSLSPFRTMKVLLCLLSTRLAASLMHKGFAHRSTLGSISRLHGAPSGVNPDLIFAQLLEAKDETIQAKDEAIQAKDEAIQNLKESHQTILKKEEEKNQAKDNLIKQLEFNLTRAYEETARVRAEFCAEVNLRPIIEADVVKWCNEHSQPPGKKKGMQAKIDHVFKENDEEIMMFLKQVKAKAKNKSSDKTLRDSFRTVYDSLSKPHHDINVDLKIEESGFVVVNKDNFAPCVAALLCFFKEDHFMVGKDLSTTLYKFKSGHLQ